MVPWRKACSSRASFREPFIASGCARLLVDRRSQDYLRAAYGMDAPAIIAGSDAPSRARPAASAPRRSEGSSGLLVGSVLSQHVLSLQDRHSPFYIAPRMARGGGTFRMVKLRSMRILADRSGVMSTAGDDPRITAVGRFIRKWKLDELTQLWNVLKGDMSLVGPRPQVEPDARLYTS